MRKRLRMLALVVVALAALPYINALKNEFVLDDIAIVVEDPLIRDVGNFGQIFTTNYCGTGSSDAAIIDSGLYRPLTVFSYAVDYGAWKLDPVGYHAVNVVLHAIASVLLFFVALEILASPIAAAATAAVFAVHPMHTEAVTSIVGRAELLAAHFFIAAFWFARSRAHEESNVASVGPRSHASIHCRPLRRARRRLGDLHRPAIPRCRRPRQRVARLHWSFARRSNSDG